MADTKITALAAITTVDPAADVLPIVDISDTSMAASGTTKKITSNQILGAGGTATLASATITGDLTVDTSTLKVDSANNRVGVNTATPGKDLEVTSSGADTRIRINSTSVVATEYFRSGTGLWLVGSDSTNAFKVTRNSSFGTNDYFQIDSATGNAQFSGNLGLGVTPSAGGTGFYRTLELGKVGCGLFVSTAPLTSSENTYFSSNGVLKYNSAPEWSYGNAGPAGIYGIEDGVHKWYNAGSGSAGGVFVPTQAMTLDASGNLLVGTTGQLYPASSARLNIDSGVLGTATFKTSAGSGQATLYAFNSATTGDNAFITFGTEATFTSRGGITYNRAGGLVAYNTTSDYRAKDIIGPVSNSGSLIDALEVYVGKMKGATIERPMLIAHEAQEVAPYAVTGQKDDVDAEGNPKFQQMDASSLVPLLIAEIKSLRSRVATLENK